MAGRGKRFADAGYKDPKPFIDIQGKTMIERVIENININEPHKFHFICLKEFILANRMKFESILKKLNIQAEFIITDKVTEGAACTILLAREHIDNNDELIIANCDQLVTDHNYMNQSINFYRNKYADGGILCFLNSSPKWSYVRMYGDNIIEVVEKQVISNIATVGIYYYKYGSIFVKSALNMIHNNCRVNNEFYVAPTYNQMIISGMKVIPFMINDMIGLGTPEDLVNFSCSIKL